MLQRIQSLLLLLAALALGIFLSADIWTGGIAGEEIKVNAYQIIQMKGSLAAFQKSIFYVALLAALATGLSVFTVFQFRNRVRQMLFVALNSLFIGAAVAVSVYHIKYDAMTLPNAGEGSFGTGLYAGFAALAFNWLANRFIKRDEKMVKDADRMR